MKHFSVRMLMILLCLIGICTSAQASNMPYTVKLDAEEKIYQGHGEEFACTGLVGKDGVYTIVEESYDEYGNLWGRLKSGAGWVMLVDASMAGPGAESCDPYTVALAAWVPIYDSPSETDGICVGIVGEDGVFTIVGEVQDDLGNIWGKLKSGAGWVNLNYVRFMGQPPMTAYFADVIDQIDDNRCDYIVDDSEYMVRIAFRANEQIGDITFATLQYDDGYEAVEKHCWFRRMEEGSCFVAGVVFYGDMTTYGISFVDAQGEQRNYDVSLNGANGALVMNEYVR